MGIEVAMLQLWYQYFGTTGQREMKQSPGSDVKEKEKKKIFF